MDGGSGSHHVAHKPYSVLNVVAAEHIVSGAGMTLRTPSVVPEADSHLVYVPVHNRTRLQLMHVFQRIERSILNKATLSHGYFKHLKSGISFRL